MEVDLHPLTQLVVMSESIVAFLAAAGKVDLPHRKVVLISIL